MPEAQKIAVRPRAVLGKKVNALRRQGVLPAVIFGGHADSVPVETDAHAFELGYRRWGTTTLLSLEGIDGGEVSALIHGVSRDVRTGKILHVDFARVSLTERTHADVPLRFIGSSGAVRTQGAVLLHALDHVRVEAFPQDIPHEITVDLTPLEQIDDTLHIRHLVVDQTTVRILNDPDDLVVKTVPPRAEEIVTPPAAAAVAEEAAAVPAEEGEEGEAKPAAEAGAKPGAPAATAAKPEAKPAAPAPPKEKR